MDLDLSLVLENITSPVIVATPVKDEAGRIVDFDILYTNEAVKCAVGFIIKQYKRWSDFEASITSDVPWYKMALDAIAGRQGEEARYFSPSTKAWYQIEMNYLPDQKYVIVNFTDITSERKYYEKLRKTLITDPLTGFMNRAGFEETFNIEIESTRFSKTYAALLIVDIDNLKNINDSKGTKEGDALIKQVSDTFKQFQRENVQVFRYGDDEFALIISKFSSIDSIVNFIDCIYEAFQIKQIGLSGGVSFFPEHSELKDELIRFADMAIHYAKKNGKNNFVYFEPDMQRAFIQKLTLQTKMTTAIIEGNFRQYYQPQFDIRTGELRGFEALLRWKDEEMGDISPSVFIPIAEETGLIIPIGRWVMKTAISTLKTWEEKYNFEGIISVNVSTVQLMQDNFMDELTELLSTFQINPDHLEIEITESVMIKNMTTAIHRLEQIRDMNIRISLDDFGTGYSSLSYLQKLPLNTLKIDKAFINNITAEDGVQANITQSIINMVGKMGLETIAEGVEHTDQLDLLDKFNCNIVQGFLRGKPMPFNLCDAYLAGDSSSLLKN